MACSTRALKLMRSVGFDTMPSNCVPSGLAARMVSVSNESMPPMLNENDVLPFLIGPSIEYLVAARLLGRLLGRERVARVQRLVAEGGGGVVAPVAVARPGADVDAREAGLVVLGGIRIEAEADLGDLRLRRQPAAREAVDAHDGAGAGHVRQLLGHLLLVVGQGVDLVLRQRRREVVGDVLVGLVARDLDLLDVAGDREQHVAVLPPAAADVDVGDLRGLEADGLDLDRRTCREAGWRGSPRPGRWRSWSWPRRPTGRSSARRTPWRRRWRRRSDRGPGHGCCRRSDPASPAAPPRPAAAAAACGSASCAATLSRRCSWKGRRRRAAAGTRNGSS